MTPEIARKFNVSETTGIIVMSVDADSKGAEADVRVGDIIKEINHQAIESVKDYRAVLKKIEADEPVNMFIWRKNIGFLVIKMTK
jgi:serine protease Do